MDAERDESGYSLFDEEERVMRRADSMIGNLESVTASLREFAEAYRQGYREQKRLLRISDRLQQDLYDANAKLGDQADELRLLNSALQTENQRREELAEELLLIATTDVLTGLHTRRHLLELGGMEEKRRRRHGERLSLMMMDLDFFKKINDAHGHAGGDEVLRDFADICRTTFRGSDIVGRFGGEEFLAILPATRLADARLIAERLRVRTAQETVRFGGAEIRFTVSIGITEMGEADELHGANGAFEQAISRADAALYKAKNAGRNRTECSEA